MSAATSPAVIPRTPSNVRRHHSHATSADRPQTTPTRADLPPSPSHHSAHSQPHSRSASASAAPQLANVARHDHEQSNLARPSSSRQPSDAPARSDSTRNTPSAQHTQSRYHAQDMTSAATANSHSAAAAAGSTVRRRTTIDATTGHWDLGKTIGAGSMGKVKLARNKETGEQVRRRALLCTAVPVLTYRRLPSRSSLASLLMNIATPKTVKEPIIPKRYAPLERLLLSHSSTTRISAACATLSAPTITGICYSNMSMVARCLTISFPMVA